MSSKIVRWCDMCKKESDISKEELMLLSKFYYGGESEIDELKNNPDKAPDLCQKCKNEVVKAIQKTIWCR